MCPGRIPFSVAGTLPDSHRTRANLKPSAFPSRAYAEQCPDAKHGSHSHGGEKIPGASLQSFYFYPALFVPAFGARFPYVEPAARLERLPLELHEPIF